MNHNPSFKHTATPWQAGGIYVADSHGMTVAVVDTGVTAPRERRKRAPCLQEGYANAAFIAHAANSHDAMLAALKAAQFAFGWGSSATLNQQAEAADAITAAINLAEALTNTESSDA